jgi:acyl carrier protein
MQAERSTTPIEAAILRRIGAHLAHDVDPSAVDCATPLFDQGGFELDGYVIDSLLLADIVIALERDFDVKILGCASENEMGSVAAIAAYIGRAAQPASIAAFEREWS